MQEKKIVDILSKMTINLDKNFKIITEEFGNINYKEQKEQSLLHIFLGSKYDENQTILVIKTLIKRGKLNVNEKDYSGRCIIQKALLCGYSENFILELIDISYNNPNAKLNINSIDNHGNSIMHTAIKSKNYVDDIISIYSRVCQYGFKSLARDNLGNGLIDCLDARIFNTKFTPEQIMNFKKIYYSKIQEEMPDENLSFEDYADFCEEGSNNESLCNENSNIVNNLNNPYNLTDNDIKEIKKIGKILNLKEYITNPAIGMDTELENLIISLASLKTSPLLKGEPGVGKTILIDELAYRIVNNQVPDFLKNKLIIEVNPSELVAGTKYAGTFETKIKNLMEICSKYDAILFIDRISRIYGTGTHDKSSVDMADMLIPYMEKDGVKIIGLIGKNGNISEEEIIRNYQNIIRK